MPVSGRRRQGSAAKWLPAGLLLAALAACSRSSPETPVAASGEALYREHCAVCHMADGLGVPDFQPPLVGSEIVAGDPATLEAVIRAGSFVLRDRENPFGTEMPPFGFLTDAETLALIDYLKEHFVPVAPSPQQ